LIRLDAVLKSGHAFPKVELRELITPANGTITIEDDKRYKLLTCKLHGQGVVFREYSQGEDIKTKTQQVVRENQLLVAEIDAKNGGYGVVPLMETAPSSVPITSCTTSMQRNCCRII